MTNKGFSLIELIVVLAIFGILITIAYPDYQRTIIRTRRVEGQTALLELACRLEHYFTEHRTYKGATLGNNASNIMSNHSLQNGYVLRIVSQTDSSFALQAIPDKTQAFEDKDCQTLTLDNLGIRGITANSDTTPLATADQCW
ncbi:type IV pilin protein [Legionella fairfieldensis]|uniref:type IV pilin protein n=1 Tax=Legionella fairfieldensis TaxID=45064 RepID=UPI00068534EB|nr:type IV pilin protein [Legionella fairfieldensis]